MPKDQVERIQIGETPAELWWAAPTLLRWWAAPTLLRWWAAPTWDQFRSKSGIPPVADELLTSPHLCIPIPIDGADFTKNG